MSKDYGSDFGTNLVVDFPWGFPLSPEKKGEYNNYTTILESTIDETEKNVKICVPFIDKYGFSQLKKILDLSDRKLGVKLVVRKGSQDVLDGLSESDWDVYILNEKDWGFHAKFIILDNSKALLGSANLTERSMKRNLEVGVFTTEKEIIDKLILVYKLLLENSKRI